MMFQLSSVYTYFQIHGVCTIFNFNAVCETSLKKKEHFEFLFDRFFYDTT